MDDSINRLRMDSSGMHGANQPQDAISNLLPSQPAHVNQTMTDALYYEDLLTGAEPPVSLTGSETNLLPPDMWPPSFELSNPSVPSDGARFPNSNIPYHGWSGQPTPNESAKAGDFFMPGDRPARSSDNSFLPEAATCIADHDTMPHTEAPSSADDILGPGFFNNPYLRQNSECMLYDGFDVGQSSLIGQSLYTDAMGKWTSDGSQSLPPTPSYDPFTSRDMFHSPPKSSSVACHTDLKVKGLEPEDIFHGKGAHLKTSVPSSFSQPVSHAAAAAASISSPQQQQVPASIPSQTRPTYSAVAKHASLPSQNKTKNSEEKYKLQKESYHFKDVPAQVPRAPGNGPRYRVPHHRKARTATSHSTPKHKSFDFHPAPIKPNSTYGLDTFEEPISKRSNTCKQSHIDSMDAFGDGPMACECNQNICDDGSSSAGQNKTGEGQDEHTSCKTPSQHSAFKPKIPNSNEGIAKEKPFFDPKRIFASKKTKKTESPADTASYIPNNQQKVPKKSYSDGVLNNGKPKSSFAAASNTFDQACYINNDLRDSTKKRNNAEAENLTSTGSSHQENSAKLSTGFSSKKSATPDQEKKFNYMFSSPAAKCKGSKVSRTQAIVPCLLRCWKWLTWAVPELFHFLWHVVLKTVVGLLLLLLLIVLQFSYKLVKWLWTFILEKLRSLGWISSASSRTHHGKTAHPKGLKENISLPTTGEEAMKRLLACKGKDPYSILGVRADSTDEEIKRYYRKQAVLVHPDKNQQPGAEEAFKILGHAFEHIGEAEKRRLYDSQHLQDEQNEKAMHEFSDLLTKLQEKLKEAANMMRCDHCGGKHKRIPVDRPIYSARYCDKCNTRHSAREGDMWAESRVMGFLWHYYCCMEGKVFDITEWVSCQHHRFVNMQSNAHHVIYRLSTDGNRQGRQSNRTNESDLEDFLSHLFHQHNHAGSGGSGDGFGQFPGGGHSGKSSGVSSTSGPTSRKSASGGRRRKKRH